MTRCAFLVTYLVKLPPSPGMTSSSSVVWRASDPMTQDKMMPRMKRTHCAAHYTSRNKMQTSGRDQQLSLPVNPGNRHWSPSTPSVSEINLR